MILHVTYSMFYFNSRTFPTPYLLLQVICVLLGNSITTFIGIGYIVSEWENDLFSWGLIAQNLLPVLLTWGLKNSCDWLSINFLTESRRHILLETLTVGSSSHSFPLFLAGLFPPLAADLQAFPGVLSSLSPSPDFPFYHIPLHYNQDHGFFL